MGGVEPVGLYLESKHKTYDAVSPYTGKNLDVSWKRNGATGISGLWCVSLVVLSYC